MRAKQARQNTRRWFSVDGIGYQGRHRRRRISWIPWIRLGLILALILCVSGEVKAMRVMQADVLNQIAEIRIELDQIDPTLQEPEKAAQTVTWNLTDADRDLIERVVAAEARGEEYPGMAAVAQTIADRSTQWDMTPAEVVTQPYQYADPFQGVVSQEVKQAVSEVFDDGLRVWECPVLWFHESGVSPGWSDSVIEVGKVGNHIFYREVD